MQRERNRGDEAETLQKARELIHNSDSLIFDAAGVLQIFDEAEIESFFTGKSVEKILRERSRQFTRIMQHRENIREMVEKCLAID